MLPLTFRNASLNDAEALTELAVSSKRSWGYADELIKLWLPQLAFTADNIRSRYVIVAEAGEQLVGTSALLLDEPSCELDAFWVSPRFMRMGIGRRLLAHTLESASRAGIRDILVVSDPHAAGFYEHMGATFQGWHVSTPGSRRLPMYKLDT